MMQHIDMREALRQAIDEEMARDPRIFLMGEEVGYYNGPYKVSKGLLDKYGPKRVIDTPICEATFAGLGIGAAMTGLRPIIEFMSFNFSFLALDQIINNASTIHYMSGGRFDVPIVFRGPNGAAAQVSCQHSHSLEATFANFPGLIILSPSNAYDAKGLLISAIRANNPVIFLESELLYNEKMDIPVEPYTVPIGKATVLKEGTAVSLLSYGRTIPFCLEAARHVAPSGIQVEVIDLRSIKPLDIETIAQSVRKTHFCVIVEEGYAFAGIASEIACQIQERLFDELDAPIARVCQKETPMPYSKVLERETLPSVERIIHRIRQTLSK
jgi:pyruvate dehydrogenase E1 component beta subunit